MAKVNLKYIENVEGKYHLAFLEGKKAMESAKADIRNAVFSLLLFCALVAIFILVSGFNEFYIYFLVIFLVLFVAMIVVFSLQRHKGKKMCVRAVENSKSTDIVNKQASVEKASRAMVESMSSTVDKYDAREKFPGIRRKIIRKTRHKYLAGKVSKLEREEQKEE